MSRLAHLPADVWRQRIVPFILEPVNLYHLDTALVNSDDITTFRSNISGSQFYWLDVSPDQLILLYWCSSVNISPHEITFLDGFVIEYSPEVGNFVSGASSLRFNECVFPSSKDLTHILEHCKTPENGLGLCFEKCDITGLDCLPVCTRLASLYLSECIHLKEISHIAQMKQLTDLFVMNCRNITASTIRSVIQHCPCLKILHLEGYLLLDDVFQDLTQPTQIRTFTITGCRVTNESVRSIAALMPDVQCLKLESSNISVTDADVEILVRSCPKIIQLEFRKFRATTDASLVSISTHLPQLSSLKVVVSITSSISNAGLIAVATGCAKLSCLTFTGSRLITDEAVREIGTRCQRLAHLDVKDCIRLTDLAFGTLNLSCLSYLDVSGTRVTGNFPAALFQEAKMWSRTYLVCNRCMHLTDALEEFVSSRKSLFSLSLADNRLSRDALVVLAQSCANAKVRRIDLSRSAHADSEVLEDFWILNPQVRARDFKAEGCGTA